MLEWLKETLCGIALLVGLFICYTLYVKFTQVFDENSKRGEKARIIGKIGGGAFLIYLALCILGGIIALVFWLCS